MPEETKDLTNNNHKRWKGMKVDPKTGQYIVYITDSTDRAFGSIDEAVAYMTKANSKSNISVEAGSPEFSGVQRGQDNIDGVKQVTITRKLVETGDGDWKVKEKVRTDLIKGNEESAKSAYKNIDDAKEEAEYVENPFEGDEEEVKKESSVESIGTCANCGASIYPPNVTSQDMEPWFNRQIPADLLCPACGYGIGEPTNFIYSNDKLNEDAVEKYSSVDKSAEASEFSYPVKDLMLDIDNNTMKKLLVDNGHQLSDVVDLSGSLEYGDLKWSFEPYGNSYGIKSFMINVPEQELSLHIEYEDLGGDPDSESEVVEVDVPVKLKEVTTDISSVNLDNGLFPKGITIFEDGSAEVEF